MKILAIRLRNIASLAGPHEILFDRGPLARAGLFAITGPTGAGKTAILDALCLALYNDTPRLRAVPGRDAQTPDVEGEQIATSDPRTLMRRGAGEAWAEVDFVGQDGLQYRSRWSVRRARGRPDGRLQAVEMAFRNLSQGQLIAQQIREHRAQVERTLGLSFDQFTRAVLLAQAEFATFLKAPDRERAELLEKLTDSARYSRIGIRAWQRRSSAKAALESLQQEAQGLQPLGAAARSALEQDIAAQQAALQAHAHTQAALRRGEAWLQQHAQLERARAQQQQLWTQAQAAVDAAAADAAELLLHAALAPVRERCRRLQSVQQEHSRVHADVTAALAALVDGEAALAQARTAREQAQQELAAAEAQALAAHAALQSAQTAELRRAELQTQRAALQQEQTTLTARIEAASGRLQQDSVLQQRVASELAGIEARLSQAQALLALNAIYPAVQAQFAVDASLRAEGERSALALEGATAAQARAAKALTQAQTAQQSAEQTLQQARAARMAMTDPQAEHRAALQREQALSQQRQLAQGALSAWQAHTQADAALRHAEQTLNASVDALNEAHSAQAALDAALLRCTGRLEDTRHLIERQRLARSADVAALRAALRPDEPCVVCGSLEHPYRAHADLLSALQRHDETALSEAEQAWRAADQAAGAGRQRLAALGAEHALHSRSLAQARDAAVQAAEQAQTLDVDAARAAELPAQLQALAAELDALQQALRSLQQRQREWDQLQQVEQQADQALQRARQQAHQAALEQAQAEAALARQQLQHEHLRQQWTQHRAQLQALLPADWAARALADPLRTENELAQALAQLAQQLRQQQSLQQQLATLRTAAAEIEQALARDRALLERVSQQQAALTTALDALADELRALLGQWPDSQRWREALGEAVAQARAALEACEGALSASTAELAALRVRSSACQARVDALERERAELLAVLDEWSAAHPHIDVATRDRLAAVPAAAIQAAQQAQDERLRALRDARVVLDERSARLQQHAQTRPPEADPDGLPEALAAVAEALAQTQATLDARRAERLQDEHTRARLARLGLSLEAARAEYARWSAIADLIGSADGAAFRELAQAWHLDQLIAYANHHLQSFARRYRLSRGGSELGLLVIDTEMGHEQRSVHSLSGGESFLVALALALGLASLSSRQLRIESLFIDEGFGSLDPRSLDLALDALDGLQSLGRRVGVISHVQEMHERIGTQIRVRRLGQGLSTLEVSGGGRELPG